MWLNEGGQSAAGAAIDQLLSYHPASAEATANAAAKSVSAAGHASRSGGRKFDNPSDAIALARGLHVVPEYLGNRAPFADPHARAVISGLGMERDLDSLVALYVAGVAGIGYGLRQIIDTQAAEGATVDQVVISGGAGQHDFVRQLLADASGKQVVASTQVNRFYLARLCSVPWLPGRLRNCSLQWPAYPASIVSTRRHRPRSGRPSQALRGLQGDPGTRQGDERCLAVRGKMGRLNRRSDGWRHHGPANCKKTSIVSFANSCLDETLPAYRRHVV
jgi:hypothetical protein